MPIRNPFRRTAGAEVVDEQQRNPADRGFQNTTVGGAKPIQVKEPAEFKLSGMEPIVSSSLSAAHMMEYAIAMRGLGGCALICENIH